MRRKGDAGRGDGEMRRGRGREGSRAGAGEEADSQGSLELVKHVAEAGAETEPVRGAPEQASGGAGFASLAESGVEFAARVVTGGVKGEEGEEEVQESG